MFKKYFLLFVGITLWTDLPCRAGIDDPKGDMVYYKQIDNLPNLSTTHKEGLAACMAFTQNVLVPLAQKIHANPTNVDLIYKKRYEDPGTYQTVVKTPAIGSKFTHPLPDETSQNAFSSIVHNYALQHEDAAYILNEIQEISSVTYEDLFKKLFYIARSDIDMEKRLKYTQKKQMIDGVVKELLENKGHPFIPVAGNVSPLTLTLTVLRDSYVMGFVSKPVKAHGNIMDPWGFADHDQTHAFFTPLWPFKQEFLEHYCTFLKSQTDPESLAQVVVGSFILFHEIYLETSDFCVLLSYARKKIDKHFLKEGEIDEYITLINDQFDGESALRLSEKATSKEVNAWLLKALDNPFFSDFASLERGAGEGK